MYAAKNKKMESLNKQFDQLNKKYKKLDKQQKNAAKDKDESLYYSLSVQMDLIQIELCKISEKMENN